MDIHLLGGFLGSGKTTAIIGAVNILIAEGKKVGVITNDQGKNLVDTAFFRFSEIPTVEVTGGCFCCKYDDLNHSLDQLVEVVKEDVIFAESVGSCADIVATVVRPLLLLRQKGNDQTSYSVFVDSRLLRMRLLGLDFPFTKDVIYIFDKQIEEAGLLVVNKVDLLPAGQVQELIGLVQSRFHDKIILFQDSRQIVHLQNWLSELNSSPNGSLNKPLEVDYLQYGDGEACLAWLDGTLAVRSLFGKEEVFLIFLIRELVGAVNEKNWPIGHLKFFIHSGNKDVKISFPTQEEDNWEAAVVGFNGNSEIRLLFNGRIEVEGSLLKNLFQNIIFRVVQSFTAEICQVEMDCFHPGFPRPTHRWSY